MIIKELPQVGKNGSLPVNCIRNNRNIVLTISVVHKQEQ